MIVLDKVVRTGDPVASGCLVTDQQSVQLDCLNGQVAVESVVAFDAVFQEVVVAVDIVAHILGDSQVMSAVDSDHSGQRVVHSIAFYVGLEHVATQVEVQAVSAYLLLLSHVEELCIADTGNGPFYLFAVDHQVASPARLPTAGSTHDLDVSSQEPHFGQHGHSHSIHGFSGTVVQVVQSLVENELSAASSGQDAPTL